jgi:L-iditol 2-dehydrogenase
MNLADGAGCGLAVETAGTEATTRQCVQFAKKGATIVLVGYS